VAPRREIVFTGMSQDPIWHYLRRLGIRPYHDVVSPEHVWRALLSPQSPITRVFNSLLRYAIKDRASEIHIEPRSEGVFVSFRIEGELREQMTVPQYVMAPLLARIKLMGAMDATKEHVPQAGSIKLALLDRLYELQVGTSPTRFGEKVIIHIN